jgi:hypothetical protein
VTTVGMEPTAEVGKCVRKMTPGQVTLRGCPI